jgi:hypothetical protein
LELRDYNVHASLKGKAPSLQRKEIFK